jgi:nitrate/nitrite transporter NarK
MGTSTIWPITGLAYGTALGIATAFGGLGAFVAVLAFGVIGFLAGRVLSGDLDLGEVFGAARGRRRGPSS